MRAAFTSAPRAGGVSYIGATLESMCSSMQEALEVAVFSDSVERPPNVPEWVHVECRTPDELAAVRAEHLLNGRNQIRALRWVAQQGEGLVLTFEDDIEFANDWLTIALRFARMVPEYAWGKDFILLLHHFRQRIGDDFTPIAADPERTVWAVDKDVTCFGAQAVLMPARTAGKLADAMEHGIAHEPTTNGKRSWAIADQGINRFCQSGTWWELDYEIHGSGLAPLYVLSPCLVRHVGFVSSWADDPIKPADVGGGAYPTTLFKP